MLVRVSLPDAIPGIGEIRMAARTAIVQGTRRGYVRCVARASESIAPMPLAAISTMPAAARPSGSWPKNVQSDSVAQTICRNTSEAMNDALDHT